ncbi:hypothetical protein L0V05_05495 [Tabrizicola sp. J26]|uniref:hypothetical protein n=1 Tax=Alitabrizicola rongguiensis TaxID=2909234 RepID=UPI001F31882E|nr:hypothetical protein [Tabrizicola rongguiensis]MCF1708271.1 hypothetical protein [Tabrizicola rongguiensis]
MTAKPLLQWTPPEQGPAIGPDFDALMMRVDEVIASGRRRIREWIVAQGGEQLAKSFDRRGVATEPAAEQWQRGDKQRATDLVRSLHPAMAAALGAPRLMADFEHWGRSAYFELSEALWLSFGLEPAGIYEGRKLSIVKKDSTDLIDQYALRRAELIRRRFNPDGYDHRVSPTELLAWVQEVELDVHPGFAAMLADMVARSKDIAVEPPPGQAAVEGSSKFDDREKRSLSMLLVALAITDHGYQPNQARSPIPKEFEDMAARLGLELTRETILKYLRLGASQLPEGWEPLDL